MTWPRTPTRRFVTASTLNLQDMKDLVNNQEHIDAGLVLENFDQARQYAIGAANSLMMSDAVLLFPPVQLALAALRSGFKRMNSKLEPYLKRVLELSNVKVGFLPSFQLFRLFATKLEYS